MSDMAERPSDKSPFPGMDPYMERRWRDAHTSLISYARDAIQPQLPQDLIAYIEENVRLSASGETIGIRAPDVYVIESSSSRSSRPALAEEVVDEPVILAIGEDLLIERHIEIRAGDEGPVVTAIEILSPRNKVGRGRAEYLDKREQYYASRTNLVEIDLVRAGDWLEMVPPFHVPPERCTVYRVTVKRAASPVKLELYPIPLRATLPTIRIPLREGEPDVRLALQPLVERVYQNGRYSHTNYAKPLDPPLEGPDAEWADQLLQSAGRR